MITWNRLGETTAMMCSLKQWIAASFIMLCATQTLAEAPTPPSPPQTSGEATLSSALAAADESPHLRSESFGTPTVDVEGVDGDSWSWHVLPDGLMYRPYLAGVKEPRIAGVWSYEKDLGWMWDTAVGGRVGLLRYGTERAQRPQGWQLDLEGAAFPRLDMEHDWDVVSTDFRVGVPLTYSEGRMQLKFGYVHICSHLGDEYLIRYPGATRLNYVRDSLLFGVSYYLTDNLRLYAETGLAFSTDDGAEPWEFQFGVDYSPVITNGLHGSPFVALNGHIREEVDFGGNFVFQAGWQWRGKSEHLMRAGVQYFAGKSEQYEFYRESERKLGLGLWYDF